MWSWKAPGGQTQVEGKTEKDAGLEFKNGLGPELTGR